MIYSALSTNWSFKLLFFISLLTCSLLSSAQTDTTDTSTIEFGEGTVTGDVEEVREQGSAEAQLHNPRKATIMSAVLPGLGQVYNKKYWKVPIIYGGFALAGYYLNDNLNRIEEYTEAFKAATDDDPNTTNTTGFTTGQLQDFVDQYKQWRDLSYIAIVAIYVLNIIDANVDAHLFYFDVSEDISLNISPYVQPMGVPATGLTLTMKL